MRHYRWAAAPLIAAALVLGACTNPPPTHVEPSTPQVLPPTVMPTSSAVSAHTFDTLFVAFNYQPDKAPLAERDDRGVLFVPGYIQAVMDSYHDVLAAGFKQAAMPMPRLVYDITARGDLYTSSCERNGEKIQVSADTREMLYCTLDAEPDGAISVPQGALVDIWRNTSQKQGDLSVAITVTRQASLITVSHLQRQLQLPAVTLAAYQHMAVCLSGAWAHAVYPQDMYSDADLQVAMERSFAVPPIGTTTAPTNGDRKAMMAWTTGFRSGNPGLCGKTFWV